MVNIVGQVIKQVSINSESTMIDLENISSGIYFYQLLDRNNILKNGKIIVE
ncbi:MAG: T9SS type A sorting domain-containing protein [Bacteroidetes bacterium]|nr:T9SS type A sorting domain-containing protein [Bacteroidota bacterium]